MCETKLQSSCPDRRRIFLKRFYWLDPANRARSAREVADFLHGMALRHVKSCNELYRIYYCDCLPLKKKSHNPVTGRIMDFDKDPRSRFRVELFEELKRKRKVALRLGHLKENGNWLISHRLTKPILAGVISGNLIGEQEVKLEVHQKGVDMKIGVDIATLAYKKLVDRIILIAGDADFVPASKLARVEGIDFILDPLWNPVDDRLLEHVDGIKTVVEKPVRSVAA